MSDSLLIHGSCHGTWCWEAVIPALAALGHHARAIDLPGRDGAPVRLADQAQAILAALHRPALVVGHSAGGYPITAAAERDATHIPGLVYLCATCPPPASPSQKCAAPGLHNRSSPRSKWHRIGKVSPSTQPSPATFSTTTAQIKWPHAPLPASAPNPWPRRKRR